MTHERPCGAFPAAAINFGGSVVFCAATGNFCVCRIGPRSPWEPGNMIRAVDRHDSSPVEIRWIR
jgi:hypothetical protein